MIGHILICISTSLVLYLVWKLTRTIDQLDQAEKHIVRIDDERRVAKAEISALRDQLGRAKETPWVRCVGCEELVSSSSAIEQAMNVWECENCRTTYCVACGSLDCRECGGCIRGCPWATKTDEHCECDK